MFDLKNNKHDDMRLRYEQQTPARGLLRWAMMQVGYDPQKGSSSWQKSWGFRMIQPPF